jgi:hypothetical protein
MTTSLKSHHSLFKTIKIPNKKEVMIASGNRGKLTLNGDVIKIFSFLSMICMIDPP